jgi:hypothetical protein
MYEIRVVAPMFPCWVATHKREVEVCVVTVSITFPATEGKGEKNNPTTQIRLLLLLLLLHMLPKFSRFLASAGAAGARLLQQLNECKKSSSKEHQLQLLR